MKYRYPPILLRIISSENITIKTKRYELFTQHIKKTTKHIKQNFNDSSGSITTRLR